LRPVGHDPHQIDPVGPCPGVGLLLRLAAGPLVLGGGLLRVALRRCRAVSDALEVEIIGREACSRRRQAFLDLQLLGVQLLAASLGLLVSVEVQQSVHQLLLLRCFTPGLACPGLALLQVRAGEVLRWPGVLERSVLLIGGLRDRLLECDAAVVGRAEGVDRETLLVQVRGLGDRAQVLHLQGLVVGVPAAGLGGLGVSLVRRLPLVLR